MSDYKVLNKIVSDIMRRPVSQARDPYTVPQETWAAGQVELDDWCREHDRDGPLCHDIGEPNYLVCGVPVIIEKVIA